MGLIKKFEKATHDYLFQFAPEDPPAVIISDESPRGLGDLGSVEEFYARLQKAEADMKATLHASYTDKRPLALKSKKQQHAELDFKKAVDTQMELKAEFTQGAIDGFYFNRTKNIQAILSRPDDFFPPDQPPASFAANVLIELLKQSRHPDGVPAIALAAITPRDKQIILNDALAKLNDETARDDKTNAAIAALEKANAGAPVPEKDAPTMIRSKKASKKLVLGAVHRFGKE